MLRDRIHGGQILAAELEGEFAGNLDAIVLALPRGGLPVAAEVARALHLPMDVYVVRKLGVPGHEELAMGAIATGGVRVINREVVELHGIQPDEMEDATAREKQELARREELYRDCRPAPELRGRTVILIDDGLATGSTMRAAAAAARAQGARKVIIAVPVASARTCEQLYPKQIALFVPSRLNLSTQLASGTRASLRLLTMRYASFFIRPISNCPLLRKTRATERGRPIMAALFILGQTHSSSLSRCSATALHPDLL